ncbi:MAG: hypothetical protein ACRDOK_02420 [Streptosporangiaceae bacterium]
MTTQPEDAAWAGVVPDDDPGDLAAVARLQVLNTLILAGELHSRGGRGELAVIRYETAVLDPEAAGRELRHAVPEVPGLGAWGGSLPERRAGDSTFATDIYKDELTACLTAAEAGEVRAAAAGALAAGRDAAECPAWDLAHDWASGDRFYSLAPPRRVPEPKALSRPAATRQGWPAGWVRGRGCGDLRWRSPRRWTVSPGFGTHPVYWVTWIGAAAFVARHTTA